MAVPHDDCMKLAKLRLEWASRYIEQFRCDTLKFVNSGAYNITGNVEDKGEQFEITHYFKVNSFPPDHLRFLAADAIHHLGRQVRLLRCRGAGPLPRRG